MTSQISDIELRRSLDEVLDAVQRRGSRFVISRDGGPVAALIDVKLLSPLGRILQRFDTVRSRLAAGYADVPEETGMAEINAAVEELRRLHG